MLMNNNNNNKKKNMKTLLALNQQQPLYIITNQPKNDQTIHFLHSKTLQKTFPNSKTSCKLHAQAKGFGNNTSKNTPLQKKGNDEEKGDNDDDEGELPQVVFDRMLKRILVSVGVPMGIGVFFLKVFDYLKEQQIWDVPRWAIFASTFVFLGSSVLGVAYGSLSTSLEVENEGSLLGFDEVKENWSEMWKEDKDSKK